MKIILGTKKFAQRAIGLIWVLVAIWVIICGIWVLVWIWRLAQVPPRELPDEDRQEQVQPQDA